MKKILEVLQYGNEIRFNTDINVEKNPEVVSEVASMASLTMLTKLWGGNELSVIAMIRALSLADLSVSVNREEMIQKMDEASRELAMCRKIAEEEFKKNGGKIQYFAPGVKPPKGMS